MQFDTIEPSIRLFLNKHAKEQDQLEGLILLVNALKYIKFLERRVKHARD